MINPSAEGAAPVEMGLDYVGSLENAAIVVSKLGVGEKRLVFADSRRTVEKLAAGLSAAEVETFVSHSSLSASERHRAEKAFAEASDCVIVSTSTLELGIDVGNLDRVLQIGAPGSVASLLQRLGRTGRRAGTRRNMQLLAVDDTQLLRAAGVLLLWGEGFVEPIVPPPTPHHLAAQQALAIALQEGHVGKQSWPQWLGSLPLGPTDTLTEITDWLVETGHLDSDQGMLFIGPETERKYGRRHFMELMTIFSASPQMTVFFGKDEIGSVDPVALLMKVQGPRVLALGGRSWKVNSIEWAKRRVWVEPADRPGQARWLGRAASLPYEVADAMRRVLLGEDAVGVAMSRRAAERLDALRDEISLLVDPHRRVVARDDDSVRWWTWAGGRAIATLHAALGQVAPALLSEVETFDDFGIALHPMATPDTMEAALVGVQNTLASGQVQPDVSAHALEELKFSDLLPPSLARKTLADRLSDHRGAGSVASSALAWRSGGTGFSTGY